VARVDNVVHGLSLATITRRCLDETPFVQVSTTLETTSSPTVAADWRADTGQTVSARPPSTEANYTGIPRMTEL